MRAANVGNGRVHGLVKQIQNKKYVEFLCIPYCKPPTKEMRFQKSRACEAFSNEVINKVKFETCLPQLSNRIFNGENEDEEAWIPRETQDENSLYVNVWCPLDIFDGDKRKPVFVWIYGGGFVAGSSSLDMYNGSILSSQENIIVVSFNYRISMLGFLCLDDELMKGNFGIGDQILALKWIHENISTFKGDPENITIAGNSAGGSSVSLHLLIEESWQYYNRVIMLSGVCYSYWAMLPKEEIIRRSVIAVNKILKKFNYPLEWKSILDRKNKLAIIEFLQGLDFKEFLIDPQLVTGIGQFAWTPFVDGELIKDKPRNMFRQGKFKKCSTIFLNVENEGSYFIIARNPHIKVDNKNMTDVKYINDSLQYFPHYPITCKEEVKEKIRKEYKIHDEKIAINTFDQIIGDEYFVCDSIALANDVSKVNKEVYYLWFRTSLDSVSWPKWCGIMHGEEIYYVFGHASDKVTSTKLMSQFSNFMTNGNLGKDIPNYNETSKTYISIESNKWITKQFTEDQFHKVFFWENLKKES